MSLEESFRLRKISIISVGITLDLNLEFSTFNSILFEGRRNGYLFIESIHACKLQMNLFKNDQSCISAGLYIEVLRN